MLEELNEILKKLKSSEIIIVLMLLAFELEFRKKEGLIKEGENKKC